MWHPLRGRPNILFPELSWTPAIELRVAHTRWDAASRHPAAPGLFINRHVAPGRTLPQALVTRDQPDLFSDPATGVGVSLAGGPGGQIHDPRDGRTRHQRDWDFIAMHLRRAIARHEAARPLPSLKDWQDEQAGTDALRTWRICEAISDYVVEWKNRFADHPCRSPHPVDVLLESHHCGGTANTACAMAHVAGIPARRISTSGHSTVEFLVGGRWVWSDNIRCGLRLHSGSYQDFLAHLDEWPHVSPGQRAHHCKAEVFYRAPYDYTASCAWRFGSGCPVPQAGGDGDAASGYGVTVHHDPSTATALYPELAQHVFAGDAGDRPWLTLGAKGGWLHAPVRIAGGLSLRRRIYISACDDNPIQTGEVRVWIDGDGAGLTATCDGEPLKALGTVPQRHLHRAAAFAVPSSRLSPGWHELVVSGSGGVIAFPDAVDPYEPPVSAAGVIADADTIRTDPVFTP